MPGIADDRKSEYGDKLIVGVEGLEPSGPAPAKKVWILYSSLAHATELVAGALWGRYSEDGR